ncbi:uncharacterized protein LOC101845102 [Aplysia californica]|uniref:Uncharacterized protein LOC101845102 n=1 Tax=Aplysia californica TaxID=6500 RepID=A0ABM0JRX0_APLCA|nr:uncharacterized protein LOC101845102 [Aplysia californica]
MRMLEFLRRFAPRVPWSIVFSLFIAFIISFYMMFTIMNDRFMHHQNWYDFPAPCSRPKDMLDAMAKLAFTASDVLTQLNVSHALCYGTLWGALRNGEILPWDNNVDVCVMREQIQRPGWHNLHKAFQSRNLPIVYDYRHGEYSIVDGSAEVVINVFYSTVWEEVLHDGWEHRFLWFFQDQPVSFPRRLLALPLPKIKFHGKDMPIPHDDLEMLKYLYRDNWWLVKTPPGCPPSQ